MITLDKLKLTVRARTALTRYEITTTEKLIRLTPLEFLRFQGVGKLTIRQIQDELARHHLYLGARTPQKLREMADDLEWQAARLRNEAHAIDDHT